jgi:indoleamine 2,3-dioxygenase
MRDYMPGPHRRFLEKIESVANIRDYVQKSASPAVLTAAYNLAVARLVSFRDIHLQIVARYIIGPSRRASLSQISWKEKDIATISSKSCSKDALPGTGGTALLPFLKQSRDETRVTNLA